VHEQDQAFNDMVFIESLFYKPAKNLLNMIKPLHTKYVAVCDSSYLDRQSIEEEVKNEKNKFTWINILNPYECDNKKLTSEIDLIRVITITEANDFIYGSRSIDKVKE
jgi:hypothetical protein